MVPAAALPRTYHILLPAGALVDGDLRVDFTTATAPVEADPRDVGIRLDDLALSWSREAWAIPDWRTLLIQWALVTLWVSIASRLALPIWSRVALGAGLVLLLSWMTAYNLPTARAWQMRLLAGSAVLLALLWLALQRRPNPGPEARWGRKLQRLQVIVVVAVITRLFGVFYPPFDSHDLYIHRERLQAVQEGSLQLFDTPTEFGGRKTLVPPAFYLLVSPLTLLTVDAGVAIEGLFAFVDGIGVALVALLVLLVNGSARAAALAALTAAGLPIQLTALWWGFGPQIVAHWLVVGAVVIVGRDKSVVSRRSMGAAGFLLCVAFLMHPGVAMLGGTCLGLYVALVWLFGRNSRQQALRWGLTLASSALLAAALLYAEQIGPQLRGGASGATAVERGSELARIMLVGAGLQASLALSA